MSSSPELWENELSKIFCTLPKSRAKEYASAFTTIAQSPYQVMKHVEIKSILDGVDINDSAVLIPAAALYVIIRESPIYKSFKQTFDINTIFFIRNTKATTFIDFFKHYKTLFDANAVMKISFLAELKIDTSKPSLQSVYQGLFTPLSTSSDLTKETILSHDVLTIFLKKNENFTYYYSSLNDGDRKAAMIPQIFNNIYVKIDAIKSGVLSDLSVFTSMLTIAASPKPNVEPDVKPNTEPKTEPNAEADVKLGPSSESKNQDNCCICYENKQEYAFIPCGHRCLCRTCASGKFDKCPICRQKHERLVLIYTT